MCVRERLRGANKCDWRQPTLLKKDGRKMLRYVSVEDYYIWDKPYDYMKMTTGFSIFWKLLIASNDERRSEITTLN